MINTYLQFEGKIHYGSKVVAITRNYTKFLSFKATIFSNPSEIFRWSMNSLNVKAKFQIGQFKSLKQIFCKFVGQSNLEGQCQGHKL